MLYQHLAIKHASCWRRSQTGATLVGELFLWHDISWCQGGIADTATAWRQFTL
jgi:hypothetical protein